MIKVGDFDIVMKNDKCIIITVGPMDIIIDNTTGEKIIEIVNND